MAPTTLKPKINQKTTTSATRSSSRLEISKIRVTDSKVTDAVSAQLHLDQTAMAISGKPFSTNNLSDILFHVTQIPGVTLPVQLAIRSVAFLLEEAAENEMADKVAKLVLTAVSLQIAKIQDASKSISSTALHLNIAATKLQDIAKATTEESPDSSNKLSSINSQLKRCKKRSPPLALRSRTSP
jgi:hypothetical protein